MTMPYSTDDVYDHPEIFEIAYSFRDIAAEVASIVAIIQKHSAIPVRRVLEVGCGSAPHLEHVTKRGYHYIGLDNNPKMLAFVRHKSAALPDKPELVQASLTDFQLDRPADFAMVLLGSLYVESSHELVAHLDCMAKALNPGALYLLDWAITIPDTPRVQDHWTCVRNNISVHVTYETHPVQPVQQVVEETIILDVQRPDAAYRLTHTSRQRVIYPQEFRLLIAQHPGFDFVGWWDNWDLNRPLQEVTSIYRPITVIRRR